MNLQQMTYIRALVDGGFSISKAAQVVGTTQPAVSKQLHGLERELGCALFRWQARRIVGLTAEGEAALRQAGIILGAIEVIRKLGRSRAADSASLHIATTHTHARYLLLPVLRSFLDRHPGLKLALRQGATERILAMVAASEVDLGIGVQPLRCDESICAIPCFRVSHSVVFPVGHALQRRRAVSLQELASFPIITLSRDAPHGARLQQSFLAAGLNPRFVFEALDSDVMKAYVEAGLGVAIIPKSAFSPLRDRGLRSKDVSHLFEPVTTSAFVLRGRPLTPLVAEFLSAIAPHLSPPMAPVAGQTHLYPDDLILQVSRLPEGPPSG